MTKKEYYELMCNMDPKGSFKTLSENWFKCFEYILKSTKKGFTKNTIHSLFYDWDMENWKAMHKENTEYKDYTYKQLIESFCGECWYISDRVSYDRLFRTHWLFKQAFKKQLDKIKYTNL